MSIKISYSNRYSIGGRAENDMNVGHRSGMIGSNTGSMQHVTPGVLVVLTDSSKRLIYIAKVIRTATDSESRVWVERGGKMWRYNYRVKPLTPVVKLKGDLKIVINEITGGNKSDFWDNNLHHTHSCNNGIVQKVVEEINRAYRSSQRYYGTGLNEPYNSVIKHLQSPPSLHTRPTPVNNVPYHSYQLYKTCPHTGSIHYSQH